jgi:uncharacterized repeat protein (TIGR01451 family)
MSKINIDNFNENRARISATATILLLSLLLLLSIPLLMFPKIVVATDGSDEEDPVKIFYGGSPISSPPGPSFDVCLGESLTFTVLVQWDIVPAESSVNYVVVQMVEKTNFGITFNPQTSFTLYNPSPNSINVVVNVPAFWTTGIRQVNIYADVIAQNPPKGKGIPNVAGTDGYFQVNVISCQADLSIDKVGSTTQAHEGDTITYTYYVDNAGPYSACNVVVSDNVLGTPTFVGGDTNNNGCIDPDETWTYTAEYTVQAGDPDPLVNTATVSSDDVEDPDPSNNVDTWSVDILHPAIDVSKSGPQYAHESDTISYTITVKNTGDTPLYNVIVTDTLLGNIPIGFLDVGQSVTLTLTYTVNAGDPDPLVNTATASGEDPLDLIVTDTASWTVDVLHPAIAIDKSADKDQAHAGDTITYTITVTNTGDTPLYNVIVTDTLLGNIPIGFLDVGQSVTLTLTYTVLAGDPDPLVNTATASGQDILGEEVTATDTWSVDLIAKICGFKFYDANANGVWDAGEPPVAGFKIELYSGAKNIFL